MWSKNLTVNIKFWLVEVIKLLIASKYFSWKQLPAVWCLGPVFWRDLPMRTSWWASWRRWFRSSGWRVCQSRQPLANEARWSALQDRPEYNDIAMFIHHWTSIIKRNSKLQLDLFSRDYYFWSVYLTTTFFFRFNNTEIIINGSNNVNGFFFNWSEFLV